MSTNTQHSQFACLWQAVKIGFLCNALCGLTNHESFLQQGVKLCLNRVDFACTIWEEQRGRTEQTYKLVLMLSNCPWVRWNKYSKLMANWFLVFLCFQIVLAFNMNGTCKQEVMPLAVRASLFLTVVSHLTLTPLLVKCLPLVNSVPYVIQYNAKCAACTEWVSHFPFINPKMLWFRTWFDIFIEIYLSLVQKRFTENWVLPMMSTRHKAEPIRWNAL